VRSISRAEFDQLVCNRCGDCCEQVCLSRPLNLVLSVRERKWDGQAVLVDEPTAAWFRDLTYLGERDGTHLYRCRRFRREADGTGTCTRYDERPLPCSQFPYGKSMAGTDWYAPRCVWHVLIEGESE